MNKLEVEYQHLLASQVFDEASLDYAILENHKPFLSQLAKVSNSGVTVFDMHKRQHVYTSYNFTDLFGYNLNAIEKEGTKYFDSRVHPDDMQLLLHISVELLSTFLAKKEQLANYKLINEYRILNSQNEYVRIIEQHQLLEFDKSGNIWLSLSVLDLSPDQTSYDGVQCKVLNYKTGEYYSIHKSVDNQQNLSPREIEILQLVKDGFLSKEISEQLFISVHTVNTHRQRILEKLNVDNSMEAVKYASRLGLVN